jgi:hypothetical protein
MLSVLRSGSDVFSGAWWLGDLGCCQGRKGQPCRDAMAAQGIKASFKDRWEGMSPQGPRWLP